MLVTRSRFLLTKTVRLLFISNLFPDMREPYRGLDNAAVLHALSSRWEIHTLALRPVLPWARKSWQPRADDVALRPTFVPTSYVPKFGTHWNHKLAANALRRHLDAARRDAHFDVVLCSWLFPDACAVARLQDRIEPVWKRLLGNCHLTRPVTAAITAAGFVAEPIAQQYRAPAPRFAGWMEWGTATRL